MNNFNGEVMAWMSIYTAQQYMYEVSEIIKYVNINDTLHVRPWSGFPLKYHWLRIDEALCDRSERQYINETRLPNMLIY